MNTYAVYKKTASGKKRKVTAVRARNERSAKKKVTLRRATHKKHTSHHEKHASHPFFGHKHTGGVGVRSENSTHPFFGKMG